MFYDLNRCQSQYSNMHRQHAICYADINKYQKEQLTSTAAFNAVRGADQDDSQTPMQGDEAFMRSCVTSSSAAAVNPNLP